MHRIMTAVIIAAYISREIREWLVYLQARRKGREHQKDEDAGDISPPTPPFFISFWRNLIMY